MPASVKDALKRKIGKGFYTAWTQLGHWWMGDAAGPSH